MSNITLKILCKTLFGQNLFVKIDNKVFPLTYTEEFLWVCSFDLESKKRKIEYSYFIINQYNKVVFEDAKKRKIVLPPHCREIEIYNELHFYDTLKPFKTKPFAVCFSEKVQNFPNFGQIPLKSANFVLEYPALDENFAVGMLGSFCGWNEQNILPLRQTDFGIWHLSVPIADFQCKTYFKFVVFEKDANKIVQWEEGTDRVLEIGESTDFMHFATQFRGQNLWRASGTAIPVFSLKSASDWGVGEFMHLKLLADWAKQKGQKIIQILPINDTTETRSNSDSYPYRANSVFALHPIYINLEKAGKIEDEKLRNEFEKKRKCLNSNKIVEYADVLHTKLEYLKIIFRQSQNLPEIIDFKRFVKQNKNWLLPYAVYCCLRDNYGTADFSKWGSFAVFDNKKIKAFAQKHKNEIEFHYFLQYHLENQLIDAVNYLHSKGIALKGDLPIGVSPNSVEMWQLPHLFHRNRQAGAPPDGFSQIGQNWGFPTYNWQNMAKDGYQWWKARLRGMENFFDAVRIDHILGFFRIWEIPKNSIWGLLGTFNPAMPLSVGEIEKYGIKFDKNRFTQPFINHYIVNQLFGKNAEKVTKIFLRKQKSLFCFKKEFDNQQKIVEVFPQFDFGSDNENVLNALLQLHCEKIFIEDETHKNHFHPRISLTNSFSFQNIEYAERHALIRLYENYFFVRHNEFWKEQALRKLPALISATNMLVCGEDLGMIPDCVPDVMRQLQILSLEIQRMPKDPKKKFENLGEIPYMSVCTTSTHDMSPLRLWWREDRLVTQQYYNEILWKQGAAPEDATPEICRQIIDNHLNSPAMLTILPLQDWLSADENLRRKNPAEERINIPANPQHYWCYRMHLTLEELIGGLRKHTQTSC